MVQNVCLNRLERCKKMTALNCSSQNPGTSVAKAKAKQNRRAHYNRPKAPSNCHCDRLPTGGNRQAGNIQAQQCLQRTHWIVIWKTLGILTKI